MDIHKPKPIHSLKELASEIGVIVIGILIALGLEQAIENWHARRELAETREAIEAELRQGMVSAELVARVKPCQDRQLALLSDAIGRGDLARARELLDKASILTPVPTPYTAWSAALASNVSNQFDLQHRTAYTSLTLILGKQADLTTRYFESEFRLRSLLGSGLARSPAAESAALTEVAEMTSVLANMQGSFAAYRAMGNQQLGMTVSQAEVERAGAGSGGIARCAAAAAAMDAMTGGG